MKVELSSCGTLGWRPTFTTLRVKRQHRWSSVVTYTDILFWVMYACMHTLLKVSFLPLPQNNLLLFAAEESKKRGIVKHN